MALNSYRAVLADKIEQTIDGTQFEPLISNEDWHVILNALRGVGNDGPKTPQVPTDEMKKAGAGVRVNLQFHNQGISGFLSEFEVGEIYERMEEKRT